MHKLLDSISVVPKDVLGYYGMYLSRREIAAGEGLNLMLAILNMSEETFFSCVEVYIQRSDIIGSDWELAAHQDVEFTPVEGKHVYMTITPEAIARIQKSRKPYAAEYIVYAGEEPPGSECANALTDIFSIVER